MRCVFNVTVSYGGESWLPFKVECRKFARLVGSHAVLQKWFEVEDLEDDNPSKEVNET